MTSIMMHMKTLSTLSSTHRVHLVVSIGDWFILKRGSIWEKHKDISIMKKITAKAVTILFLPKK